MQSLHLISPQVFARGLEHRLTSGVAALRHEGVDARLAIIADPREPARSQAWVDAGVHAGLPTTTLPCRQRHHIDAIGRWLRAQPAHVWHAHGRKARLALASAAPHPARRCATFHRHPRDLDPWIMQAFHRIFVSATTHTHHDAKWVTPIQHLDLPMPRALPTPLAPRSRQAGPLQLITLGRIDHDLGLDLLLRAIARVRPHVAHLTVVGDGPSRGILTRTIQRLGLESHVTLVGAQPNIRDFLRASDVFVMPARRAVLPTAVIESCVLGLPLVTTDAGALPSLVNETHGCCVPRNDVAALAEALVHCHAHMATLQHGAWLAAQALSRRFSPAHWARLTARAYDLMMAGGEESVLR